LGFIVLFGYNFFANFGEVHFAESVHRAWAPDYWNLMLAVLVADIATHWYSPVNLHYRRSAWASLTGAEEYKRAEITKLFARGTILMSAIWFVLLVFYIFSPIKPLYPNLLMGADAPWQQVLCLLAVLGALMSTLDSTLIACARQLRDALPKLDKKLGKYSEGLLLTLLNLFTAGLGIVMIIKTPNLFQMLMGTVGCLVFFFPGMLYAVLLKNRESLSRRRIAMSYVVFGAIVVLNLFELAVGINNFGWRIPLLAGLAGWLMLPPRAREFARATAI
jgi:Na+/proline symporter